MKVRNTSLHNARMQQQTGCSPRSFAEARCPWQTHFQANSFCLSVHFPSGSTGLSTKLPAFFPCT